jgi:CBS domain-containing protein
MTTSGGRDPLLVADVMTLDPIVIRADATLERAMEVMRTSDVRGLPVVDDGGSLIGVISQTDLVAVAGSPLVGRLVRGQPDGLRVGELMTHPAITVPFTEPLAEAARLMVEHHVHRLVAVDDAGHAVGVLSAIDFVALYAAG